MPVYEYKCKVCDERFDVEQSINDDALTSLDGCSVEPSGQHQLKKVFHAVGIAFKGEGFYRNDSRPSSSSKSGTGTADNGSTESSSPSESSSSGSSGSDSQAPGTTSNSSSTKSASDGKGTSGSST